VVVTFYVVLEALTIAFFATRALASTALDMFKGLPIRTLGASLLHLGYECLRIAFKDVKSRLFDHFGVIFNVAAISTSAIFSTLSAFSEAFTIHL